MSVRMDLHNLLDYKLVLSPDQGAGDNVARVGNIIDRQGFHALEFVLQTGTLVDGDVVFAVLLEESDEADLSGGNAVADADMLGTELLAAPLFTDDDTVKTLGYIGTKRYVRLTVTPSGNTGAWDLGILAVQSQRVA